MSKITNDGLTRSAAQDALYLYPYGNSGSQRVTVHSLGGMRVLISTPLSGR